MGGCRVVVVDAERAVAEALAAALSAAVDEHEVTALGPSGADVVVHTWPSVVPDPATRSVLLLSSLATPEDVRAAQRTQPAALVSRDEPLGLLADAVRLVIGGATFTSPRAAQLLLAAEATATGRPRTTQFTAAETRVLTELATSPDTRSRVARRLGVSTSTLDNHLGSIKRKVLAELLTRGNGPTDGYLSMEALVGWATRQRFSEKT